MKSERFFCKKCNKFFNEAKLYDELHGLDSPPYERVAVCPNCEDDGFVKFEFMVEKIEIAEKILPVIMYLNRYVNALKNVFGERIKNFDVDDSLEILIETLLELFDFCDKDTERKMFEMCSDSELRRILMIFKGEL